VLTNINYQKQKVTIKRRNKNIAINTLMYETRGSVALAAPDMVEVVSTVSRPMDTLAGDDSMLIQNETQDRMTISTDGT